MLYFAYGSNLAPAEMPDARFAGLARLDGYRLDLTRRSIRWQAGVLDMVPWPGGAVWGAVYEISPEALERLDAKEGAGLAYRRIEVELEDGRRAIAYEVIDKEAGELACAPEYAELVLAGARGRGMPAEGLHELERGLARGDAGKIDP